MFGCLVGGQELPDCGQQITGNHDDSLLGPFLDRYVILVRQLVGHAFIVVYKPLHPIGMPLDIWTRSSSCHSGAP
jgi:hypothetical protein